MALVSNLITATKPAQLDSKYSLSVGSLVNTDSAVVDSKANTYYNDVCKAYDNLYTHFNNLANEFKNATKCLKKKGNPKLYQQVQKIATACANQGTYCKNRKSQLQQLYKYASLESKVSVLEAELDKLLNNETSA